MKGPVEEKVAAARAGGRRPGDDEKRRGAAERRAVKAQQDRQKRRQQYRKNLHRRWKRIERFWSRRWSAFRSWRRLQLRRALELRKRFRWQRKRARGIFVRRWNFVVKRQRSYRRNARYGYEEWRRAQRKRLRIRKAEIRQWWKYRRRTPSELFWLGVVVLVTQRDDARTRLLRASYRERELERLEQRLLFRAVVRNSARQRARLQEQAAASQNGDRGRVLAPSRRET